MPWCDHGLRGLADICSALMAAIADRATAQAAKKAGAKTAKADHVVAALQTLLSGELAAETATHVSQARSEASHT